MFFLFLLSLNVSIAQETTVGLFFNDSLSYNGYTLFAPGNHTNTYLIDNCGYLINEWESEYDPGFAVYLLENGNIMRVGKVESDIFANAGIGGVIQEISWEGELVWEFHYYSDTYHQHHDIEYLPNGNVLMIVWESFTAEEALQAGKNTEYFINGTWLDKIIEVEPDGLNGGTIVWEWRAWDHLIQDFDPEKDNYGMVENHPEKIDFNYSDYMLLNPPLKDWMHANSIDYNEELDQIVISLRHYSEFWVIDHSTTTEEASGSTGGIYGKGGDLLYRWGNPEAYGRGTENDQLTQRQHDVHWIPNDYVDGGKFILFNNEEDLAHSSIMVVDPPQDSSGFYTDPANNAYGPELADWKYENDDFFSIFLSGVQRLPNGNTLICEGATGRFFEVTYETQETVWKYICPVNIDGIMHQGDEAVNIQAFRVYRYSPDYPAFDGLELEPGEPIEINPNPYDCTIYDSTVTSVHDFSIGKQLIVPNPFNEKLKLELDEVDDFTVTVYNMHGMIMTNDTYKNTQKVVYNTKDWLAGMYIIQVQLLARKELIIKKVIKSR